MKREIIKIQQGNDTYLSIRALLPDGKTQVPIDDTEGFKVEDVKFAIAGHEVDAPYYTVDNGLLVVQIDSDLVLGKYGIHVKGKIVTQQSLTLIPDVDCNFYEVFEIVPYSDSVRYDNYYTDIFIVGLPDSTYEQLKRDLEEKIQEAEDARERYEHKMEELDDLAHKSDIPTDYARQGKVAKTLDDIKIDTTDLAKEDTSKKILGSLESEEYDGPNTFTVGEDAVYSPDGWRSDHYLEYQGAFVTEVELSMITGASEDGVIVLMNGPKELWRSTFNTGDYAVAKINAVCSNLKCVYFSPAEISAHMMMCNVKSMDSESLHYKADNILDKLDTIIDNTSLTADKLDTIQDKLDVIREEMAKEKIMLRKHNGLLYEAKYSALNYHFAKQYFRENFVPAMAGCSVVRKGNQIGRNLDWYYDNEVEFIVEISSGLRYASKGFVGTIPELTKDDITEKMSGDIVKILPFRMLDGINEKGVYASVNMLNNDPTRSLADEGTIPAISQKDEICSMMLVRYILDNFESAQDAAEYIRDYVCVYPPIADGKKYDAQIVVADKEGTWVLSFEGRETLVVTDEFHGVVTNFRLAGTILIDGKYKISQIETELDSQIERYGSGVERANEALHYMPLLSVSEIMSEIYFTPVYNDIDRLTEFTGDGVTIRDTMDLQIRMNKARRAFETATRESGGVWHTTHKVVYDLASLTGTYITQEIDDGYTVTGSFDAIDKSDGGITPEQYDALAKADKLAELSTKCDEIDGKVEGIGADIKALDADVLQGKRKLAAAITQKGVRTAYTESLSDMAINVSAIPQTTYTGDSNFDAMVMPSEYMWNVYKIAENLIGNNPYPYANRFFVAEYYRGYDSLVLSGADAYLTCDGDYYEVMGEQCIHTRPDGTQEVLEGKDPNHIWHDSDNGKMNRYVVFFFQADTYTFSNTTAAICPRRVAISGNCASFIVTGENRLTDVYVLGTLGHFEGGTTGESWNPAQVIRNYSKHSSGAIYTGANNMISCLMPELKQLDGGTIFNNCSPQILVNSLETINSGYVVKSEKQGANRLQILEMLNLKSVHENSSVLYGLGVQGDAINFPNLMSINAPQLTNIDGTLMNDNIGSLNGLGLPLLTKINLPRLKTLNGTIIRYYGQGAYYHHYLNSLHEISLPSVESINGYIVSPCSSNGNSTILESCVAIKMPMLKTCTSTLLNLLYYTPKSLIDIEVGELEASFNIKWWNPTNVLADDDKKAQLISNIRNHILAKVSDNSGASTQLVFTVSTNMFNSVTAADPNLVADFGAKGWSFRGA